MWGWALSYGRFLTHFFIFSLVLKFTARFALGLSSNRDFSSNFMYCVRKQRKTKRLITSLSCRTAILKARFSNNDFRFWNRGAIAVWQTVFRGVFYDRGFRDSGFSCDRSQMWISATHSLISSAICKPWRQCLWQCWRWWPGQWQRKWLQRRQRWYRMLIVMINK